MSVSYEYYRVFYYAAKYRNLTLAAEALHNNQPNISRVIKLLEHEFGCRLLIRSNRGITLTPEGERLYSYVKIAMEQIQAAEEEMKQSAGMQKGSVTIGASETALRMLVLPVLSKFKKSYPEIRIKILNHFINQALESVKKGIADFSVVATPAVIEKTLKAYPVMEFEDILIGGPSYAAYQDTPMKLKDVNKFPLVCLGETTMTYQFYAKLFQKNKLELKPELEAATMDQIIAVIKNDLGVGFVSEVFAKDALEKGEVFRIPLREKLPKRQICIVENVNRPLSVAAKELETLMNKISENYD